MSSGNSIRFPRDMSPDVLGQCGPILGRSALISFGDVIRFLGNLVRLPPDMWSDFLGQCGAISSGPDFLGKCGPACLGNSSRLFDGKGSWSLGPFNVEEFDV